MSRYIAKLALKNLCWGNKAPGWNITNNTGEWSSITWNDNNAIITKQQYDAEYARLQNYDTSNYQQDRQAEYPKIEDFVDAFVKGDDTGIAEYRDKCFRIKYKYPKPSLLVAPPTPSE